ncbi:MAG: NF038129 family PEP-CTERM protein [Bryobacterales bacterium]|nr:NF038129 family PEP-CTERM protein [Bryobacterales bacterium]
MMRAFLTLLAMAGALGAAPVGYRVIVDTAAFAGTDAQVEFQFNPGGTPDAATAEVSALAGIASFTNGPRTGDVTGSNPWLFGNSVLPNQLFLNLTGLGALFSFQVVFSGDAIDNPAELDGTAFTMTMRDTGGNVLGGFSEPSLWLEVSGGAVLPLMQDQQITLSEIPEPRAMILMMSGLLLLAVRRRCFPG